MVINCLNISGINDKNYELFRNAVSEERRIKADRFYYIIDSYRSVCAELLLQYSLFEKTKEFVEVDIKYNRFGKPYVRNTSDFFYNLSHSGEWVVIAYGKSDVGVDIEKIQVEKDIFVDRVFSEDEKKYVYKVSGMERSKRFTEIWTLKESYIKYLGTGFSTEMNSFSINAVDGIVTNQNGERQNKIIVRSKQFDANHFLAVCGEEENIVVKEIMLEELIRFIRIKISQ